MHSLPSVHKFIGFLIMILFIVYCNAEPNEDCKLMKNCSACIQIKGCVWCAKIVTPIENDILIRCENESLVNNDWCPNKDIVYKTIDNKIIVLKDDDLMSDVNVIQIKPQKVQLKMRKGEEIRLNVAFQQAKDYPLDLYLLFDPSYAMYDINKKFMDQVTNFIEIIKGLNKNFNFGFGSFVDKTDMPFFNTNPKTFNETCILQDVKTCSSAYGYKHRINITNETKKIEYQIKTNIPVSTNHNFAEGGFDAIMQALVCTEKIGWRPKSHRMLMMVTNAGLHTAGDGKLVGIIEPNDEKCHLNNDNEYSKSNELDYPSVSQINKQAIKNNINIVFAVDEHQKATYKALSENIEGAYYEILKKETSNIADIVKTTYEKLLNSIKLSDNSSRDVQIQYFSKCSGTVEKATNECNELKGSPVIDFGVVIKILDCPIDKKNWKQTIQIRPGALSESLIVDLEILCDCPCERAGYPGFENKSISCSSNGDLTCGICSCDSGKHGKFCQCDNIKISDPIDFRHHCKENHSSEICSGYGFCKCGKCDCKKRQNANEVIYGKFCECDNYSCNRHEGLLCSGIDNGRCECGKCICQSGWSGSACECKSNNATCIAPNSKEICSGRGSCVCGTCQCNSVNIRYSGKFCQECSNCTSTCEELATCVECKVHKPGLYSKEECEEKCDKIELEDPVDKLNISDVENIDDNRKERQCEVLDDKNCVIIFKYKYENDDVIKRVTPLKTKDCSKNINTPAVVGGIVGGTVIAGVIMLVMWKIITMYQDKRDFAKFEKESGEIIFNRNSNPLYEPTSSQFNNPAFGKWSKKKKIKN